KWNRFLVIVVGEIRDKKTGFCRNFVGDTTSCLLNLGLNLQNVMVLHTCNGNAPIKARKCIETSSTIMRTHQSVLCFFKGDNPKEFRKMFGKLARHSKSPTKNTAPEDGADRMQIMTVILILHLVRE